MLTELGENAYTGQAAKPLHKIPCIWKLIFTKFQIYFYIASSGVQARSVVMIYVFMITRQKTFSLKVHLISFQTHKNLWQGKRDLFSKSTMNVTKNIGLKLEHERSSLNVRMKLWMPKAMGREGDLGPTLVGFYPPQVSSGFSTELGFKRQKMCIIIWMYSPLFQHAICLSLVLE